MSKSRSSGYEQSSIDDYVPRSNGNKRGLKEWSKLQEKVSRVLIGWMQSEVPVRVLPRIIKDENVWTDSQMVEFREAIQKWMEFKSAKDKYYKASYCGLFWVQWPEDVKADKHYDSEGGVAIGTKTYQNGKVFNIDMFGKAADLYKWVQTFMQLVVKKMGLDDPVFEDESTPAVISHFS